MPKNRDFNLSVWLILYSKLLYLKCMIWINSRICCDCYTKINLFFTVLNYGPKRLVNPAVLRKPETCMWSLFAEITFWRRTSHHLRGNDSTEGQCHVPQIRLHKSHNHSFLIPHSQIGIPYPHQMETTGRTQHEQLFASIRNWICKSQDCTTEDNCSSTEMATLCDCIFL